MEHADVSRPEPTTWCVPHGAAQSAGALRPRHNGWQTVSGRRAERMIEARRAVEVRKATEETLAKEERAARQPGRRRDEAGHQSAGLHVFPGG